ncbi:MAG: PAS domain S-box protein [Deltaproteobacteria bacterium]|nr:PAS domain S-box protein [Deltaproteobacteria bacterium]
MPTPREWFKNCAPQSGIAQRLFWYILMFSLFMSIITGGLQSYFHYQRELAALEENFTDIERSQFPAIIENVCLHNTAALFKQACAIKNMPYIVHVTINDRENELAFAGESAGRNLISRQFPITCFYDKATRQTAMLTVTASTDDITSAVMKSFLKTLIRDALNTLLLVLAILLFVHYFFKRRINVLINCIQGLSPQQVDTPCVLQRAQGKTRDELAMLAASINALRCRLLECYKQLNEKKLELNRTSSVLTHILHSIPLAIFWKDTRSVYLGCNEKFALLVDLESPDQIIGRSDLNLKCTAEEVEQLQACERSVIEKKQRQHIVQHLRTPAGSPRWLDSTLIPLIDDAGSCYGFLGLIEDITGQKLAQENLRQSEQRFRSYFELPLTGIVITSTEKSWLDVNDRACEILGYTKEELLQQTWSSMTHPEDLAGDVDKFNLMLAGEIDQYAMEKRFLRKDGSIVYVNLAVGCVRTADGGVDYVVALFDDISEQKKSRDELMMLSAAVQQAHEIIVITDIQAVIQYVNPEFSRTTGYSSEEAIGNTPALLRSGKHDEMFYQRLWSTILQGDTWRGRFINRKKNGELYDEEAAIYPICNAAGRVTNYVAVKRDITHDLKMEQQLRQVQKMEAIGTLAGGIAHDFNNILGVIYGYAEMSLDPSETMPQINSNLQQLISAANRAKDLIRQILTISRQTEKEALPVTISPIIKEVIRFIRASLPSTIQIKQSLSAKNDLLLADPIQIHQLLMNLCTNAGHAMKESGGVLEINLHNMHFSDTDVQEYPLLKSGDYLCLAVRDTGCGISDSNMEHIFEPYFTTKEPSEGTGLGLAVVHGIVRKYSGDIRVTSEVGKGTSVNIYLPVVARETESKIEIASAIPRGTEHILFVDDEDALVKTSKIILERLGYRVTGLTSSEQALALFNKTPDAFDLLITDKTMPELSGFDLVQAMKTQRPDMPMILCTGVSIKSDFEKVQEIGINAFILKPFNKQELACIIRDVLDRRHIPEWAQKT